MEEYQNDAEWHDKTNGESPHSEKRDANRSSICKLISYQLFIHKPSQHDTRQECTSGQHQLGSQEITEIHQRHAEKL